MYYFCLNKGLNSTTLAPHKKNCPNDGAFLVRKTPPDFVFSPITRREIVHQRCEIPFHSVPSGDIKVGQKRRAEGGVRLNDAVDTRQSVPTTVPGPIMGL